MREGDPFHEPAEELQRRAGMEERHMELSQSLRENILHQAAIRG